MSLYGNEHFPGSSAYRALALLPNPAAREAVPDTSFPWSERHLRCVWADPAWRPSPVLASDGRAIVVENPGRWNLEAGPDFLDAVLRIGPGECVVRGDVELHIRPADWRHHGHAKDRRYDRVIAHVCYFEGTLSGTDLSPAILQISLRHALKQNPRFSFDGLDLPAYPFAALAPSPPCAILLKSWPPERQGQLLESAGEERLRLKTQRMTQTMTERSAAQTLYEEVMGALGYKQNRTAFHALAHRLALDRLQQDSGGDPLVAYALLAGVAGLLPAKTSPLWDGETRQFIRSLWDIWWKHQAAWHGAALSRNDWVLSNIRPMNQPLRRLMAASHLFIGTDSLAGCWMASGRAQAPSIRALLATLQSAGEQSYWAWRTGLASPRSPTPMALIGSGRAATILTNVVIPWLAATSTLKPDSCLLKELPPEDDNRFIRHTAHALFGHDHNPTLYHSGLRQQGLLQIFHDFCLNSRNGCAGCKLPGALGHQNM